MTTSKRVFLVLLAAVLLSSGLVSCGEAESVESVGEVDTSTVAAAVTEEVDPFAEVDFGGQTLRISSSVDTEDSTNAHHLIAGSGELNGELVNDAVYQRNMTVQELLNVELEFLPSEWTWSNGHTEIEKLVLSGDAGFEVVINDLINLGRIAHKGYFHSVSNNQIMDFSKSYWYGEAIADLEVVDGGAYMMLGDVFADCLASSHVLYYNKDIINNNYSSPDYVQDIILDGNWTVDEMIRITEETAVDLDGDGTISEKSGDLGGYSVIGAWGPMIPVLMGFDVQFMETTDEGKLAYCFNNERSVTILEKLNELYWASWNYQNITESSAAGLLKLYADQKTVFVGYLRLGDLEKMRDIEFQVGLACYPKLDTAQKNYVSSMHDTSEVGAIMVTAPVDQMDFISTVLEVMAREAGRTIIPAYYEEALKIKYVNGTGDAAMIDLIHDTITSPFALAYNNILGEVLLGKCFLTPLGSKKSDFASAYASVEKVAQEKLDELVEAFTEVVARQQGK